MKNILIASVLFGSALSFKVLASGLDVEHKLIEQRWYTFEDVIEKRSKYNRVDISRGYIEFYFEGDKYTPSIQNRNCRRDKNSTPIMAALEYMRLLIMRPS